MIFDRHKKKDDMPPSWREIELPQQDGVLCIGTNDAELVTVDLNKTPHVLIAGEISSCKIFLMLYLTWQAMKRGCMVYMVDLLEGTVYDKSFAQHGEVILTRERALQVFKMLTAEAEKRLQLFREMEVKSLTEYNVKTGQSLSRITIFIDEISHLLDKVGTCGDEKETMVQLERYLARLSQMPGTIGINLIITARRPDAKSISNRIKDNLSARICGFFHDTTMSRAVLGNVIEYEVPKKPGKFLCRIGSKMQEFQSPIFEISEALQEIETVKYEMQILLDEPEAEAPKEVKQKRKKKRAASPDEEFSFSDFDDIEEGC